MKGGRGMLIPKGAATLCVVSKHADADANGTSPYPLHKGDLVCARGILVYALRSFAALRMTITQDDKRGK